MTWGNCYGRNWLQWRYWNSKKYKNFEEIFNVEFIELKNNEVYSGNNFKIKAYELEHGICKPILGFILQKEEKKIGYATDTVLCENLIKMCKESNAIFIDATNTTKTNMHIGLDEVIALKKENKSTRFFAIHRSNYKHNNIKNIEFPDDGDEIEI